MAFAPEDFKPQYREIDRVVRDYRTSQIVLETNKRVIVRFECDLDAREFNRDMERIGYACSLRWGKQTPALYAQVLLRSPF